MELDQIRIKLNQQSKSPQQPLNEFTVDWPKTTIPRPSGRYGTAAVPSGEPTKLFTTVETLQQRATYPRNSYSSAELMSPSRDAELQQVALQEAKIHLQRLTALADQINFLSSQQENLMGEIQAVQGKLQLLQPHLQGNPEGPLPLPTITMEEAVLAIAERDRDANLVLTYRSAMIPQPEQEAREVADHLRGTYGAGSMPQSMTWSNLFSDFGLVWQEPADMLGNFWHQLRCLKARYRKLGTARADVRRRSQSLAAATNSLSVVDLLIWFGSGVIGRAALNLVLSTLPFLWSFAVAALTAVTAYALYRATLAPNRDFGLACRVFLVIAGLVIGGRI
jgi:hypothetical protein